MIGGPIRITFWPCTLSLSCSPQSEDGSSCKAVGVGASVLPARQCQQPDGDLRGASGNTGTTAAVSVAPGMVEQRAAIATCFVQWLVSCGLTNSPWLSWTYVPWPNCDPYGTANPPHQGLIPQHYSAICGKLLMK